ncbi:YgiT-type zinc finger protein [Candidatus Woesearchaeota archaeon]|nr:YgiT-type zinc finger protein [Candidatus Woesearchaeota archaeon]
MEKCYICEKGKLENKKVPYSVHGELVGEFPAQVCVACGETFFSEENSKKITEVTKAKGLFGLGARTKIGEAGSTLDIRLPQKIIQFLKLKKGEEVMLYPESRHRLVVEI